MGSGAPVVESVLPGARAARTFKEHDDVLQEIADVMGDETVLVAIARWLARDLEQLLRSDNQDQPTKSIAWDTSVMRRCIIGLLAYRLFDKIWVTNCRYRWLR